MFRTDAQYAGQAASSAKRLGKKITGPERQPQAIRCPVCPADKIKGVTLMARDNRFFEGNCRKSVRRKLQGSVPVHQPPRFTRGVSDARHGQSSGIVYLPIQRKSLGAKSPFIDRMKFVPEQINRIVLVQKKS